MPPPAAAAASASSFLPAVPPCVTPGFGGTESASPAEALSRSLVVLGCAQVRKAELLLRMALRSRKLLLRRRANSSTW